MSDVIQADLELVWSLTRPCRLHWRCLDGDWVIYEEASNQTVVLDTAGAAILLGLMAGPMNESVLIHQVLDDLAVQQDDDSYSFLHERLARMKSLGLIDQRAHAVATP